MNIVNLVKVLEDKGLRITKVEKEEYYLSNGKIRIKTLNKFLKLHSLAREKGESLTVEEIMETIGCCRSHAYNYRRALEQMLPPTSFDPNRERSLAQECLM